MMTEDEIREFREIILDKLVKGMNDIGALTFWGGAEFAVSRILKTGEKPIDFHEKEKAERLNKEKRIQDS